MQAVVLFQDKPALFRSFYKWLKPGGRVLISDYCRNAGNPSAEFAEYIKQRGYDLHDVEAYGQVCLEHGIAHSLHAQVLLCQCCSQISVLLELYLHLCLQMLRDAGFVDVIAEDRTDQVLVDLKLCLINLHVFIMRA